MTSRSRNPVRLRADAQRKGVRGSVKLLAVFFVGGGSEAAFRVAQAAASWRLAVPVLPLPRPRFDEGCPDVSHATLLSCLVGVVILVPNKLVTRAFVAGATGAIGRQAASRLIAEGHEVHGMTCSESKRAMLVELGPCRWSWTGAGE